MILSRPCWRDVFMLVIKLLRRFFALYWGQLASITALKQALLGGDGTPGMGEPGEYDPAGTLAHFGATSNNRDVFFAPQCSGLATNLLQCWFHKAGLNLPQSDCADEALIACHHVHGQRNWEMFPDAGVSVPDFSTSVATRH